MSVTINAVLDPRDPRDRRPTAARGAPFQSGRAWFGHLAVLLRVRRERPARADSRVQRTRLLANAPVPRVDAVRGREIDLPGVHAGLFTAKRLAPSSSSSSSAAMIRSKPCSANRCASSKPMPLDAPVTNAKGGSVTGPGSPFSGSDVAVCELPRCERRQPGPAEGEDAGRGRFEHVEIPCCAMTDPDRWGSLQVHVLTARRGLGRSRAGHRAETLGKGLGRRVPADRRGRLVASGTDTFRGGRSRRPSGQLRGGSLARQHWDATVPPPPGRRIESRCIRDFREPRMYDRYRPRCGFALFPRRGSPPPPEPCPRCEARGRLVALRASQPQRSPGRTPPPQPGAQPARSR